MTKRAIVSILRILTYSGPRKITLLPSSMLARSRPSINHRQQVAINVKASILLSGWRWIATCCNGTYLYDIMQKQCGWKRTPTPLQLLRCFECRTPHSRSGVDDGRSMSTDRHSHVLNWAQPSAAGTASDFHQSRFSGRNGATKLNAA